jgi:Domain of unknown function (DUF5615)
MSAAYYMDVNVSMSITTGLRRRGIDVVTSQEDGTRSDEDEVVLARATDLHRVLVSHDNDLLGITKQWQTAGRNFEGFVFIPQRGSSIGQCVADLELIASCCSPSELVNQVVFLPLD